MSVNDRRYIIKFFKPLPSYIKLKYKKTFWSTETSTTTKILHNRKIFTMRVVGTPTPTAFNFNFSNVLILFLFWFFSKRTEAFAPTCSLKCSSLSYSCNGFSMFVHFTFLLLLFLGTKHRAPTFFIQIIYYFFISYKT